MRTPIALVVFVAVNALLLALRRRLGMFWSTSLFLAASLVYLAEGFEPALPGSILSIFGGATVISVLLYITSSDSGRAAFWRPLHAIMVEPGRELVLIPLLIAIPALVAWRSFVAAVPSDVPPPLVRTVHPSPPASITVNPVGGGEAITVDLIKDDNPLRALQKNNPAEFASKVAHGKVIYYQNCFYCHGDHLAADGHYAKAMRPRPADFQDPSVLPLFQESFFFWRIAKGGPGLPAAGTPWDSVMPVWENFLGPDDMWSAILFLYDHTGYKPRGREAQSEGAK
jgi:mono/diheme cytochrome c family protein